MNKVILGLLLAVCVLGMALIMLNERLGRKNESGTLTTLESNVTEHRGAVPPAPVAGRSEPDAVEAPQAMLPFSPQATDQEYQAQPATRLDMSRKPENMPDAPALPVPVRDGGNNAAGQPASPAEVKQAQKQPAAAQAQRQSVAPGSDRTVADAPKKALPKTTATAPEITKAIVFARDNGATVRFSGNGPIRYKSMTLDNPNRVVVDMEGQWQVKAPGVPKNAIVSNVRIGKLADKTRIVIDLKDAPRKTRVILSKERDSLDVRIDK